MPCINFFVQRRERRLARFLLNQRPLMIRKGCEEWRTPVDLQHVLDKHGIAPSRTSILETALVVVLDIILDTGVDLIVYTQRSEIDDWLCCAVYVVIGMVIVVIDGD